MQPTGHPVSFLKSKFHCPLIQIIPLRKLFTSDESIIHPKFISVAAVRDRNGDFAD
jgi:hypothetical protein